MQVLKWLRHETKFLTETNLIYVSLSVTDQVPSILFGKLEVSICLQIYSTALKMLKIVSLTRKNHTNNATISLALIKLLIS